MPSLVIVTARDNVYLHSTLAVDRACWYVATAIVGTHFPVAIFSNVPFYLQLTGAEETQNLTHFSKECSRK